MGAGEVVDVPIPHDCLDGFLGAFWRRPEAYLDALAIEDSLKHSMGNETDQIDASESVKNDVKGLDR